MGVSRSSAPTTTGSAKEPKLLDRLADALHRRKYVAALVHDYVDWVRRFIYFHHKQHPIGLGLAEIEAYIEYLAADGGATSFQRTEAERALYFLYAVVLEKPVKEAPSPPAPLPGGEGRQEGAPKLLDQLREVLRVRHYARRTEDCYVD